MTKDIRYKAAGAAFRSGEITTVREICLVVPLSTIAVDLGINYGRIVKKLFGPGWLSMGDVIRFAQLLNVPALDLCAAIMLERETEKLRLLNLTSKEV